MKKLIIMLGVIVIVIAWAPWLSVDNAKSIVKTYPNFQEQHRTERQQNSLEAEINVNWLPFCRWVTTFEGGWWVCFWQTSVKEIVKDDENQTKDNGQYLGFIKGIYNKDGASTSAYFVRVDLVQWLGGEEAIKAAMQDTNCPRSEIAYGACVPSLNNGFYIRNQSNKITTFKISNQGVVENLEKTGVKPEKITFSEMSEIFNDVFNKRYEEREGLRNAPYIFTLSNGLVVKISQRYTP